MKSLLLLTAVAVLSINFLQAAETEKKSGEYHVLSKDVLGGDGGWDYLTIDPDARRLYIARESRVMVVDMDTRKVVKEIEKTSGVHGVALVPEFNRGFTSNGRDNTVLIFDLKTYEKVGEAKAGPKPDAIVYDPFSKRVFAFNNGGTTATAIDAKTGAVAGTVELGGAPEFGVSDLKGKMYVNLEDKSQIAEFDTTKLTALNHWPLTPGKTPTGLSMDREHRRLFSGCRGNKAMMIVDADSGKVVASVPIGSGVDATAFDAETKTAFASNGDGTLTVVHQESADKYTVEQNVATQTGAKTMALDTKTHQVWTVTGDRKKPGTFTVFCLGK